MKLLNKYGCDNEQGRSIQHKNSTIKLIAMKHTYKLLFATALSITSYSIAAENIIGDAYYNNTEVFVEPRIQLTLLPGIERPTKQPLAMHMVDNSSHESNLLNLNSSLVESENINNDKYFDDIRVTNNNLFELRF